MFLDKNNYTYSEILIQMCCEMVIKLHGRGRTGRRKNSRYYSRKADLWAFLRWLRRECKRILVWNIGVIWMRKYGRDVSFIYYNSIVRIFYLCKGHTVMNYDEDSSNGRSDKWWFMMILRAEKSRPRWAAEFCDTIIIYKGGRASGKISRIS